MSSQTVTCFKIALYFYHLIKIGCSTWIYMHTSYIAWVHHLKSISDLMFLLRQCKKKKDIANPAEVLCFSSLSASCFTLTLTGSSVELLPLIFPVRAFPGEIDSANKSIFVYMRLSGHELQFAILHLTNTLRLPLGPAPPTSHPTPASFPRGDRGNHK